MFYSTEVLTSRQYGVATVWLVATLGSKSTLKKVSRKAILDVDVQKACNTIENPGAPMALRLQSNLLYGVARVYSQQCGYVLTDVEAANNSMRSMFKLLEKNKVVLPEKSRAVNNLVLPDDPNFLTEFNLGLDYDPLGLDIHDGLALRDDSLLSTQSVTRGGSRVSSQSREASVGGLEIRIPDSQSPFGDGGFFGGGGVSSGGASIGGRAEVGGLLDDLFEVGPDGMIRDVEEARRLEPAAGAQRTELETGISSVVRRDHERGPLGEDMFRLPDEDDYIPPVAGEDYIPPQDDDEIMPDVNEPPVDPIQDQDEQMNDAAYQGNDEAAAVEHSTTEETAEAPARQTRPRKALQLDIQCELRNADLQKWGTDYLQTMKDLIEKAHTKQAAAVAKKNAAHWVIGTGMEAFGFADQGPLHIFSGEKIFDILRKHIAPAGWKRPRDAAQEEVEVQSPARKRSRTREPEQEQGRADADDFQPVQHDDEDELGIEQGREAPTPLEDRHQSTLLPWNRSGSQQATGLFSAGYRPSSSIGGPLPQLSRRGSRLVSQSPLRGRGSAGSVGGDDLGFDTNMLGGEGDEVDFERYGPATTVETQAAAQSQWLRSTLEGESMNFLEFVQSAIDEADALRQAAAPGDEEDEEVMGSIDFSALLPEASNSRTVAAQGFLHVLSLGSKNLLGVVQDEAFAAMTLRIVV